MVTPRAVFSHFHGNLVRLMNRNWVPLLMLVTNLRSVQAGIVQRRASTSSSKVPGAGFN
jgi:hypothetical protein